MSLLKGIIHGKEKRKLGYPRFCRVTTKLFKFYRQKLVATYKLNEYLGLHCYGKSGFVKMKGMSRSAAD